MEKSFSKTEPVAPEGGWGWMVAIGTALVFVTTIGPITCLGLIFADFLTNLPEGKGSIATLSAISCACMCFTGFATNWAFKLFSCRQVGIFGGFLCFINSTLLAFVSSFLQMLFLLAASGIGMGLLTTAAFTSLNSYFVRRRNFVMGITQVMIGIGLMIYPIFIQLLLDTYGSRGSQIIISAIVLHSVFGAILMQPVENHIKFISASSISNSEISFNKRKSSDILLKTYDTKPEIRIDLLRQDDSLENVNHVNSQNEIISQEQNKTNLYINKENKSLSSSTEISNINLHEEDNYFTEQNSDLEKINSVNGLSISQELLKNRIKNKQLLNVNSSNNTAQNEENGNKKPLLTENHSTAMSGIYLEDVTPDLLGPNSDNRSASSQVSSVSVYFSLPRTSTTTLGSVVQDATRTMSQHSQNDLKTERTQKWYQYWWLAIVNFLDLGLLKDLSFVNVIFGISFVFYCDIAFSTLLPLILLNMGFSSAETAIFMALSSGTDLIGRLTYALFGLCANVIKNRIIFLMGTIFTILFRTLFTQFNSYLSVAILIGCIGFFRSFIGISLPLVIAESCSLTRFPAAYGLYNIILGFTNIAAGPFIGFIYDTSESYPICIHTMSALMLLCVLPWLIEIAIVKHQAKILHKESDMNDCFIDKSKSVT